MLDKFNDLDDLISRINEVGYLPEGAVACKYVHEITEPHGIKLTICNSLYRLLNKEFSLDDILKGLIPN